MKFTLSWLKDHLDTSASLDEIVETLTTHRPRGRRRRGSGEEAEATSRVAYVIEAKQHPNADRLRVCMVDAGGPRPCRSCAARPTRAPA